MIDLKAQLAAMEARFTTIKTDVENHLKSLRDQLENTPKAIQANIARAEADLAELAGTLGLVKAIKESEDLFKHVESMLSAVPADVEAAIKKVESIL